MAQARQAVRNSDKLEIKRFFTTEGVHPYDEIEWELRDARIQNFRTGEIAFEQNDVEVPKSWSQNATNIVAQKYFRGTQETPDRERSVKQMIDRVVNRYHEEGLARGYFTDAAEAQTFKDELTHLLVTQKAAFNSPVWFNVGWRAQPQVAACFILAVEDEMNSILNWYVEEGTIFKHGSGSGINLSRIRSSKERLKSGGTASGPVSFMRGADASAGTIKSGGATRRAAKMVVLNVDHPDVRDFIWCKALEEKKAAALREAGFDMDLDGKDTHSIQYQNANNSVRVTDEFMKAVVENRDWDLKAVTTGEALETVSAKGLFREISQAAWECADPGVQYDTTINDWHTCPNTGPITASNPCSEYLHVDNSACNLASLNLMKFVVENGNFDIDGYKHAVEVMFLAQEISVGFASYPTEKITENSLNMRQLGQGYANLGAMLMSFGLPYDSDEGRAWAAAITALMTGHCYAISAKIAERVGAFEEYEKNREPMLRVINKHRDASYEIPEGLAPDSLVEAARQAWDEALELGAKHGYRNAQATVLAPTGCLVGGTLVPTERGLVRLGSLGDPDGEQWQELGIDVQTDEGPRTASQFYVNGLEAVVNVRTKRGYRLKGTAKHRIKVVDENGEWAWKRFAELKEEDLVPLSLDQLFGEPQRVALPRSVAPMIPGDHIILPAEMDLDLAELVGYFMRDGSYIDRRGVRFVIDGPDFESDQRLRYLAKKVFGAEVEVIEDGNTTIRLDSPTLSLWWQACGFGKDEGPSIPGLVLSTNEAAIYGSFLEGLRLKDRLASTWRTSSENFSSEVQTLLLAVGSPTYRYSLDGSWIVDLPEWRGQDKFLLDHIAEAELGEEELTYDLSVPDNVTYFANGFVSHNTIGLLMDCDTTGIEPDLALKKMKKLVGGGHMSIVNQTVPRALRKLGYNDAQVADIVAYIDENSDVVGAPHLREQHVEVFDTAMGERSIHYMGHVKMMAAIQPLISGALSKTVNLPEDVTVEDVEQVYIEGWRLGIKALALYRDNCKVAQPLAVAKKETKTEGLKTDLPEPVRRRLPRARRSMTFKFRVADTEGYITAGEFPEGGVGEIFLRVAKQGSTLAGIMDAFAISISMGLQYGVPLSAYVKQFTNTRFEPSGMTDDPDFRIATSILDYMFRRLALEYLTLEERHALGIRTSGERQAEIENKLEATPENGNGNGVHKDEGVIVLGPVAAAHSDALPFCGTCGVQMNPAGSCFACPSCGSTSGCS